MAFPLPSVSRYCGLLVLVLITMEVVTTYDQANFKTCDQSSFCKRHRNNHKQGDLQYVLLGDTINEVNGQVEGSLKEEKSGVVLKLKLSTLLSDSSVLRMLIDEENAERKRFDAKDALVDNIPTGKLVIASRSAESVTVTFGDGNKAVLNLNPFRIDIYKNDRITISGNQRGLLKFEHYRHKPEGDVEEGMWEESFKSHHDSKPFGPMSVGMDFSFVGIDHVYGIPEHADSFALKNTKGHSDPYRLYNLDVFEYGTQSTTALYGSVPMMVGHAADVTVGMLWLNAAEAWVDIESSADSMVGMLTNLVSGDSKSRHTHWIFETGKVDVYFMVGPKPADVMRQNAQLTGVTPLPPYYSIGHHQCRWNYFSQEEVTDVDTGFDEHDIPLDAIWLDIEYTEGRSKKYFTWDPVTFSDHKTLISNLTTKGRRLITIIDPHLKKDSNYPTYNEAVENNYFIKNKEGNDYEGWCWPGASMWPDYVNPDVAKWWANKFQPEFFPGFANGVVDIWNDMNEPSVFNGPEITAPKDLKHYDGWEHRDVHNMYGMLMTKATYQGLVSHRPNLRPYILTRSFFVGSQRYCSAWTGDNMGKWDHLKESVPMLLSLSIVGMTFAGADVPGFFFQPESNEMVVRWYQVAAFQPFYRAHAHLDTKRREPWMYDEQTKLHIRDAIRLRYTFLPYMYTLFYENSVNGAPIMRPLWYHYPSDTNTFGKDDAFLLGENLLVHPIMEKGVVTAQIYFPGDKSVKWCDLETGICYTGGSTNAVATPLSKVPHFQRSGSIIPRRERIRRSAALTLEDPISLDIVLDESKTAKGDLYLDDGITFNYKQDDYIKSNVVFDGSNLSYSIESGKRQTQVWLERVTIYGYASKPNQVVAVQGSSQETLEFKYESDTKALVLRKPALNLSEDWKITIN